MKINPFINQHINLTEKILDKSPSDEAGKQPKPKVDDVVDISAEGQRKRIMGAVIERITSDDD